MKQLLLVTVSILLVFTLNAYEPKFLKQPFIAPDGNTICFTYMSDLWIAPYAGGEAKRITVSDADDSSPVYSNDGKWITFSSNRDGVNKAYIIPANGGQARLLSNEAHISVRDWFSNGKDLLVSKFETGMGTGFYKLSVKDIEGGGDISSTLTEITPIGHFFAKLSPDNKKIVFNRRGYPYRPAYTGSVNGELWEYDIKKNSYFKLTNTDFTERYPVFSYKNPYLYYGASDGNLFQLFRVKNNDFSEPEQLTFFTDWSVRNISIARTGDRIVFEKFDKLYRWDSLSGKAEEIKIEIKQDFIPHFIQRETYLDKADEVAVSLDGELIAFSYKYDLFAMPEKGGEVRQLTFDNSGVSDIVILPDNKTVYFTKREKGMPQLYYLDITKPENIVKNLWSEGKYIRYIYLIAAKYLAVHYELEEDFWRVALLDIDTGEVIDIVEEHPVWSRYLAISPDLNYIFFVTGKPEIWTRHLYMYDIYAKTSDLLLSSVDYIGNLHIGLDNESLFISLGSDLVRIDLKAKPDFYKEEDNWDKILIKEEPEETDKKKNKKEKKVEEPSFKVELEGIRHRINKISTRTGFNYPVQVVSDSTLYYVNRNGNSYSLRKIDYYAKKDEELLSFTGRIDDYQMGLKWNETNKQFYASIDSAIYKLNPSSKKRELIPNKIEYEYDEINLNKKVFDQIWVEFGKGFYDFRMHDKDWNEMYDRYSRYIDYCFNMDYFSHIVDEMIGELNASHTGFYARGSRRRGDRSLAYIGAVLDYSKQEKEGIRFKKVYSGSTLSQAHGIKQGDLLLAIDGKQINPTTSVSELLMDKIGKKIKLTIRAGKEKKEIELKGLNSSAHYDLYYENWVEERENKVKELSQGKIGYLHIQRMNQQSYDRFLNDLFAENYQNDALIIDVRNNGGGNISRQLMDVLSTEQRAYTTSRGYPDQRFKTPNRIWDKPIVLLINENSFSDAEIFPILFKQQGLGTVIGMPTGGGVIGTTPYRLIDGSEMRMPRSGWFTVEGVNMEGTGAFPDIEVDISPEQLIKDEDVQIIKAVELLLGY